MKFSIMLKWYYCYAETRVRMVSGIDEDDFCTSGMVVMMMMMCWESAL